MLLIVSVWSGGDSFETNEALYLLATYEPWLVNWPDSSAWHVRHNTNQLDWLFERREQPTGGGHTQVEVSIGFRLNVVGVVVVILV